MLYGEGESERVRAKGERVRGIAMSFIFDVYVSHRLSPHPFTHCCSLTMDKETLVLLLFVISGKLAH